MSGEPRTGEPVLTDPEIASHLQVFLNSLTDCAVYTTDPNGVVTSWTIAGEKLFGLPRTEIVGSHMSRIFAETGDREADAVRGLVVALHAGVHDRRYWRATKDGSRLRERLSIRPIYDHAQNHLGFGAIIRRVSGPTPLAGAAPAEPQDGAAIAVPAFPVANLRSAIRHRLHSAMSSGQFAILCFCIDRIDHIAGLYGNAVADTLRTSVFAAVEAAAGEAFLDHLGDSCLLMIDRSDAADIEPIAHEVRSAAERTIRIDGYLLKPRIAVGIARYPDDGTELDALVANVQAAVFYAKTDKSRGLRFFESEMASRLAARRAIASELRQAVARDELYLVYQPKCRPDGTVTGFEALLRWRHPERGLVMPAEFLPIAEEIDLMVDLGAWVLKEACREAALWANPLKIAVNLSPSQLQSPTFPSLVEATMKETGLPASRLELEITESALLGDFQRAFDSLSRVKALGVAIAMDDFGTGYSSLANLRAFPFDRIKIERSFITDIETDDRLARIVRATIAFARSIGVPVTAEGVETEAQRRFLIREGCNELQGFAIGRPLSIGAYAETVGRRTD